MRTTTIRIETYAAYRTLAAVEGAAHAAGKAILILAAPFIGLAFVVALPFIGLAAALWIGLKAFKAACPRAVRVLRNVALFAAAPFIGLAYAVALPFVGAGAIVWLAVRRN